MEILLIAHDIRSCHNVGSLARSADSFGVKTIFCTGFTPYIRSENDDRLPHIRKKIANEIHKTALGAEDTVDILHVPDIQRLINKLKLTGYTIAALEQSEPSFPLNRKIKNNKLAVILGSETTGIPYDILKVCNLVMEIPMLGKKESLNVSVAGAIAMYELNRSSLY